MPRPDLAPELLPEKYWQPDGWTARHELVCDLHLGGFNNRVIAQKLELSESRVSIILSDARAYDYVKRHRERMHQVLGDRIYDRLESLAEPALDALEEDVKIQNPTKHELPIRQRAYFGILGSLGYGPVQKSVQARAVDLPPEAVSRTEEVLAELKSIQGRFSYQAPDLPEEVDAEITDTEEVDDEAA